MGLLKIFKRKKTEIIDLSEINKIEEDKNKKFLESKMNSNSQKSESNIKEEDENKKLEEVNFNKILKGQKEINRNYETILHEYYTCKIFSRVALKDNEFNAQLIEIDKYINAIKRKMYEIDRLVDLYKRDDAIDLKNIYEKVNDLLIYEKSIKSRFKEMDDAYYGHIKMTTLSVCINKDNDALEKFYELIYNFLAKYKGFTEAAEDIYYSSGDFLVELVQLLVLCIRETGKKEYIKKYTFEYFLDSDVIITLDIKEWITLFNKIRFASKLIQDIEVDKYIKFKVKYDHLETIYTILMMRYEIASGQGKAI